MGNQWIFIYLFIGFLLAGIKKKKNMNLVVHLHQTYWVTRYIASEQ